MHTATLPEDSCSTSIEALSKAIHHRGFGLPAIFLLEMYRPLRGLAHAGSLMSAPILLPLFGPGGFRVAAEILDSQEAIEELIRSIEKRMQRSRVNGS